MADPDEPMDCPLCGYVTESEYQIMLHMETVHPEGGESPFIVKDDASTAAVMSLYDEEIQYASCPMENCGEAILLSELDSHIEMHGAEEGSDEEEVPDRASKKAKTSEEVKESFGTKLSYALRNLDEGESTPDIAAKGSQPDAVAAWKNLLKMPAASSSGKENAALSAPSKGSRRRLGKSELGPHANEDKMPSWLVKLLESDGELSTINRLGDNGRLKKVRVCVNQAAGILPVVRQLLEQDAYTNYAYLCNPAVKHVSKLRREGGFCGYRNIQMLSSYIIGVETQGYESFGGKIPTIFDIQNYIETAWDLGINAQGRIETGGIRGTRKYIGTPDAQAMLCSLGIACTAQAFKSKKGEKPADTLLFDFVESYFREGALDLDSKLRVTSLPPLYFQHPGHSMTIIGFEKKKDGSKNLIVFDPMFHDAANIMRLVDAPRFTMKSPADMLKAYRRGVKYLKRYNEFEILRLTPPTTEKGNADKVEWT